MKLTTRDIVVAGMLGAISIILGASGLGLIPVPTAAGKVTIMHVPVILGTVLEGPVVGVLMTTLFAWLLIGEKITLMTLIGGVFIIGGIYRAIISTRKKNRGNN